MEPHTDEQQGSFFGKTRKYTRHLRPEDEFSDEEAPDDLLFLKAPRDHVPEVTGRERAQLRRLHPDSEEWHEDPIMDYEDMPVTSKEMLQFGEDITSKQIADALRKKCHHSDVLDELFLSMDAQDADHDAPASAPLTTTTSNSRKSGGGKESKNKRRKKKRVQLWGLQFQGVPKVPKRLDHFFYIRKDSVQLFRKLEEVQECTNTLTPYLYWGGEEWKQAHYSLEDLKHIGLSTGFYHYRSYERVENKYAVHSFTDMKQDADSQVQSHNIMLFLVAAKHSSGCYFMVTFFFMKNV